MAETNQAEVQASTKRGGLLVTLAVAAVCGGVGFAIPMLLPQLGVSATDDESGLDIPDPIGKPIFLTFGEATVNLDEGRLNRYLRLSLSLQVDEAQKDDIEALLTEKRAILRNWLLSYMSDQSMDQIRGAAGQNRLRRAIRDHFNSTLFEDGYDRIEDVLFEDFNIQ